MLILTFIAVCFLLWLSTSVLDDVDTPGEAIARIVVDVLFVIGTAILFVTIDFTDPIPLHSPGVVIVNMIRAIFFLLFGISVAKNLPDEFRRWKRIKRVTRGFIG